MPCDIDGRLIVQGIEPGGKIYFFKFLEIWTQIYKFNSILGRIDRDGRLAVEDAIVSINGYPLKETSFNKGKKINKTPYFQNVFWTIVFKI